MTPDAIDEMVKAGASVEVLAALWKSQLRDQARAVEEKRSKDRDRQRLHRSSRDVTECHSDTADVTPGHEQKKSPQTPKEKTTPLNGSPKGEPIPPPKARKGRTAEFEIPEWVPAEPWTAFADMRRRKGKPLDSFVAKQLFGRLRSIADAGWNLEDVITKAAIGNHDGFWMPDGRDSNVRRIVGKAGARPMSAAELRSAIAYAEDQNDLERADELKNQLAALRATGPPISAALPAQLRQAAQALRA
jgi:hypothetical protein